MSKNNVNSLNFVRFTPWTKVALDQSLLRQLSLGQKSPWTIVPWTIVATPTWVLCCLNSFPDLSKKSTGLYY